MMPKKRKPKQKTFCPGCQLPKPGYVEKVCENCQGNHEQALPQVHVLIMDGRTLNLGGKIKRRPGCQ